ncbi:TIGR03087 family PEP-CTERM/XrtA system glycosyltransferase [Sphingomonas sp. H39-1-10]|uniref:TIGR03087 family PEP-CTERM/XrtA system glycosyltransferase n=1 Tax=Sphingomonas pollutisoli TaxID=3030829 RepID=UPI0023B89123|nr:TIGR03087 family PEP-CTERM/XrtA system glycosyltransferase [Sphingomonas pollutisoli]MDF0489474.1 TIGR03087 family PEP-CTERM/XrtA system glycosyltransferase [Sphingomonas pollutisoli]
MGDILFLAHRVPDPPDRGDKIRGFHILKHLSQRTRTHLVAFADDPRDLDRPGSLPWLTGERAVLWRGKPRWRAAAEALARGRPVSLTAFDDAALRARVNDLLARHPIDTIYVFSGQMAQYLPAGTRHRVLMDFVDMDSAKFADYAEAARGPSRRMMAREAKLLQAFERDVAGRADASLFVSAAEAQIFRAKTGAQRVRAIDNGIDTDAFDPAATFDPIAVDGDLIVFTGQMDYRPNIEAVTWFANDSLPKIQAEHPQARFAIVGRAPTEAVRALASRPGVIVTGEVADVRGWLAAAAAVVAPLKLARGIQNKVLEAMAMARPVVASAPAAEGIDHAGTIRVGGTADAIAEHVSAVLADRAAAALLGAEARAQVRRRYSWAACLAQLDAILAGEALERAAA